jgi:tRNA(Ile2) C34 agmatinyltransferase TiaS
MIVAEENVKPVMEELKDIRMNSRLQHTLQEDTVHHPHKSIERGYKLETVEAKNTSKTCPICGELSKPNGHVFKCSRCGIQADRHLVAA